MSQFTMLLRKEAEKCANMQDYVLAHVFHSTAVLLEEKNEGWGKFQEVLTAVLSEFQENHAVMYRSTVLRRLKLPKYAAK